MKIEHCTQCGKVKISKWKRPLEALREVAIRKREDSVTVVSTLCDGCESILKGIEAEEDLAHKIECL